MSTVLFLLVAKLLYEYKCRPSDLGENAIFSAPNKDRGMISSSFATCLLFKYFDL